MDCNISELHLEEHAYHVTSQWKSILGMYASSNNCEKKHLKDGLSIYVLILIKPLTLVV